MGGAAIPSIVAHIRAMAKKIILQLLAILSIDSVCHSSAFEGCCEDINRIKNVLWSDLREGVR